MIFPSHQKKCWGCNMNILLDTHILIWSIINPSNIPNKILSIIENLKNNIYVSQVSLWEIALKHSIGKLDLNGFNLFDLPKYCKNQTFSFITLNETDSLSVSKLSQKENHRDPFDRMLITQAINRNYSFASVDSKIQQYTTDGLQLLI